MNKKNMNNNSGTIQSNHFVVWLVVLSLIVVIGTLGLLASLRGLPGNNSSYGVFLDKGLLDTWEYKYGRADFTIETDQGEFKNYFVYVTEDTKIIKAINTSTKKDPNAKTLQPGNTSEMRDGIFAEIYLENNYENPERKAATIIYWE